MALDPTVQQAINSANTMGAGQKKPDKDKADKNAANAAVQASKTMGSGQKKPNQKQVDADNANAHLQSSHTMGKGTKLTQIKTPKDKAAAAKKKKEAEAKKKKDAADKSNDSANGIGIYFSGHMAANIVRQVLDLFILGKTPLDPEENTKLHLMYDYVNSVGGSRNLSNILKVNIPEPEEQAEYIQKQMSDKSVTKIFNPDESMEPKPETFMQYQGSIASMVNDLSNSPFNEIYWTHEDGKAVFNFRQTPFEQEDWEALPSIKINSSDIIELTYDNNDAEQASIYDLTSRQLMEDMGIRHQIPPITDDQLELISRYGYKYMERETHYFGMNTNSQGSGLSDADLKKAQADQDSETETNHYPSFSTFKTYFDIDKKGFDVGKYDDRKFSIPGKYGGDQLYEIYKKVSEDPNFNKDAEAFTNEILKQEKALFTSAEGKAMGFTTMPITENNALAKAYQNGLNTKFYTSKVAYVEAVMPPWEDPFPDSQKSQMGGSLNYALPKIGEAGTNKKILKQAAQDIVNLSNGAIGGLQAYKLVQGMVKKGIGFSEKDYLYILEHTKQSSTVAGIGQTNTDKGVDGNAMLARYQKKLFNFYADNSKFRSGSVTIPGRDDVEYGIKVLIRDNRRGELVEAYVESVSHDFSFNTGWTTAIGFTRGLPVKKENDPIRWAMFWGHADIFRGGFFGEPTLNSMITAAEARSESSKDSDDSDDGDDVSTTAKGPWILPVKGGDKAKISGQEWGAHRDYGGPFHDGFDIDSTYGGPIRAPHAGVVKHAGYRGTTYGSYIMIKCGNVYVTLQEFDMNGGGIKVKKGQQVKKGDIVANFGNGTHCHFGISTGTENQAFTDGNYNNGRWHDPIKFIKEHSK
ncbi:peptidoglycan DD-metalloendopeptidase family protein [Secundilactobacillus kimchicus]|uniref:M23 family metallopeptidase n=1 Tax=Secundilactobacillus kimchicus TaxID=528209 RepID=UPI001C016017|nr:M23 family metallopeptidase [Secundilactobacillus kimchicus]MBT9670571.1 peptidoglycan DD-metalloendopeptidase family protein [Secundilactobacillus kimchicus]